MEKSFSLIKQQSMFNECSLFILFSLCLMFQNHLQLNYQLLSLHHYGHHQQ